MASIQRCLLSVIFAFCGLVETRASEVWLSGIDPVVRSHMPGATPSDFMDLFQPNAQWSTVSASLGAFYLTTQLAVFGSDADLKIVVDGLKVRNVKIALSGLVLEATPACGHGVEGYFGAKPMEVAASRIAAAGGIVSYLDMDEPYWYGHHYSGKNACNLSIADVAKQTVASVAAVRKYFPDVKVGDSEPLGTADQKDFENILNFLDAYQAEAGKPLDFFNADIQWNGPWRTQFSILTKYLQDKHIKFGVFYVGDNAEISDTAWIARAQERVHLIEGESGVNLDYAILGTWMSRPQRLLPETKPGTLTSFALAYIRAH